MKNIKRSLIAPVVVFLVVVYTQPAFAPPPGTGTSTPGTYPTPTLKPGETAPLPSGQERISPTKEEAPTVTIDPTAVPVITGAHEFSTIPGITEDVTDIILNVKSVVIRIVEEKPKFENQRGQVSDQVRRAQSIEGLWTVLNPVFGMEDWWQLYRGLRRLLGPEYWTRLRMRSYGASHPAPSSPKPELNVFGQDSQDEPEPTYKRCGPDITEEFTKALNGVYIRIKNNWGKIFPDWYDPSESVQFMAENGANMDFWVETKDPELCPINCPNTVTLCGYCVRTNVANNIIYGFIANLLDLFWPTAKAGGHSWDLRSYGRLDSDEAQAGYAVGWVLADDDRVIEKSDLCSSLEGAWFPWDWTPVKKYILEQFSCAICPPGCPFEVTKNFATEDWVFP